ncbi:MAG: 3'(2'),5'-bisphosphate nucleotidase CysQ [Bacteroidales bacterium]|jgi:3'(2'), 5'-bisphosphate nucleotidase|nr:3'(2'),5'-bisphosphate nucleotidase CysQ [Bacteroidales bacterium]
MMDNYKKILIPLAIKAGEEIMKFFGSNYILNKKIDDSPVTEADLAANSLILEELQKTGLPILSEESKITDFYDRKNWKKFWMIDPLDGTGQFINNETDFTVNIALIENNNVTEGIVYLPVNKKLYYGNLQDGAIKMDLKLSEEAEFKLPSHHNENMVIIASKSNLTNETNDYLNQIKVFIPDVETINVGSSLKFCSVADGVADIYPRIGPISEWDIAAGHAVLKSAGGNVIDKHTKKEIEYNTISLETPDFIAYQDKQKLNKILFI